MTLLWATFRQETTPSGSMRTSRTCGPFPWPSCSPNRTQSTVPATPGRPRRSRPTRPLPGRFFPRKAQPLPIPSGPLLEPSRPSSHSNPITVPCTPNRIETAQGQPSRNHLQQAPAARSTSHRQGHPGAPYDPRMPSWPLGHSPRPRTRQEPPQGQGNGSPRPSRYRRPRMCRHGAAHPAAPGYAAPSRYPYQDGDSGGNAKSGTKNARL